MHTVAHVAVPHLCRFDPAFTSRLQDPAGRTSIPGGYAAHRGVGDPMDVEPHGHPLLVARVPLRLVCALAVVLLGLTRAVAWGQTQPARPGVSVASVTVAVLPFANLSQRPADDWIGGGLAETVATDLIQVGFTVVGRTGALDALETPLVSDQDRVDNTALEICRELGAAVLVGGGYQRVGDRLRITAHVIDVSTGRVEHRALADGALSDLFDVQDRIVAALVQRLAPSSDRMTTPVVRPVPNPPTSDTRAAAAGSPLPPEISGALTLGTGAREAAPPGAAETQRGGGFAIGGRPTAVVVRTAQPPAIDGRLDDAVWQSVTPISRFVQTSPVEGATPTEPTEVWLAYDNDNFYAAFYAHYADPSIIRANRAERDETRGDDQMQLLFDPFLDQQRAYLFSVNGYGIPGDAIVNAASGATRSSRSVGQTSGSGGGGSSSGGSGGSSGRTNSGFGIRGDSSWDALFEARGELVDDGWTAEMAIPFKSLRYPARSAGQSHRWGFQISRNIREKSESLVWSPVSRDIAGQLMQMGALEGLTDLSTSRNLEILPTFTGVQIGSLDPAAGEFREGDALGEVGLGVKYGVTSNLTLDFTYNPDFSQIESDRPQVAVNQRFALFFSEQRPFFLEGQEIFRGATPLNLVHTRTIVDPRYGAKLTGKVGRTTLGMFVADDEAPGRLDDVTAPAFGRTAQSVIGRVRYDLYGDSYVGAIATAREFDIDHDRVGGVDGRFRLGRTHGVSFLAAGSDHRDTTDGALSGPAVELDFSRQARNLSYSVAHSSIDPDFRTGTGFVPRVDIRRTDANVTYRFWPGGTLISWGPSFTYLRNHNHAGVLEDEQFRGDVNLEFVRSVRFSGGLTRDLERFGGIDFYKTGFSFSGLISSQVLSVNASVNRGDGIFFSDTPFLGRSTAGTIGLFYRPTSRLRTELRTIFSRFLDPADDATIFDVKIYRWRATYQFTDRLLARHILEHNTLNGTLGNNVLLTYRINAGTVAFLGYDDRYQEGLQIDEGFFPTNRLERTNRAFFTKISYLFRY